MSYSEKVAEVLAELDASWDDAKRVLESARRTELGKMVHTVDVEISILGEPEYQFDLADENSELPERFKDSRVFAFELPNFGDYMFLVNVTPRRYSWGQRLGRRPDVPMPRIDAVEDLRPWGSLKEEVLPALSRAHLVENFSYNEVYSGNMRERHSGGSIEVLVGFDVDLLQWVERVDASRD
ncbi:hypothetical protein AB0L00_10850 [Actinoallomurus sp. NPDC052308]|uniref:hypothetical protein n=1 Tax=Actinoallomurus sp. NPDC052308 TaxID=3155530 RepID=UPI00341C3F5E